MSVKGCKAMESPVTIRDVAARAGVALSSVSRVLSGHPDVSAGMRAKVEEAAQALGYEPDLLAQSLRSGATRTIGFIIRDIANPLFAVVARACEQELRRNGYSLILMNSDGSVETESKNFALLRRRRVDGVIASLVAEDSPYVKKTILSLRAPLVLLDRDVKGLNASAVITDHSIGVKAATKHLIESGHRDIAFISGAANVYTTRNRIKGFSEAFAEVGLPLPEKLIALGGFDAEYALIHARHFLLKNPRPTAFVAGGIGSTAGVVRAFNEMNLKIGENIALVALDEWPLFDVFATDISSVYRDPEAIGSEAAHLILEVLNGNEPRESVIDTKFTARASSQGGVVNV
jgi:LacI family transcriptional regulator